MPMEKKVIKHDQVLSNEKRLMLRATGLCLSMVSRPVSTTVSFSISERALSLEHTFFQGYSRFLPFPSCAGTTPQLSLDTLLTPHTTTGSPLESRHMANMAGSMFQKSFSGGLQQILSLCRMYHMSRQPLVQEIGTKSCVLSSSGRPGISDSTSPS